MSRSKDASGPPNPCTHPDPITSLVPSQTKIVKAIVFLQVPGSIADFHWDVHSTRWLVSGAHSSANFCHSICFRLWDETWFVTLLEQLELLCLLCTLRGSESELIPLRCLNYIEFAVLITDGNRLNTSSKFKKSQKVGETWLMGLWIVWRLWSVSFDKKCLGTKSSIWDWSDLFPTNMSDCLFDWTSW